MPHMERLQATVFVQLSLPPMSTHSVPSNEPSFLPETTTATIPNSRNSLNQCHTKIQTIFNSQKFASYRTSPVVVPLAATQSSPAITEKSLEKLHMENEYCLLMRGFWRKLLNTGNSGIMKNMFSGTRSLRKSILKGFYGRSCESYSERRAKEVKRPRSTMTG